MTEQTAEQTTEERLREAVAAGTIAPAAIVKAIRRSVMAGTRRVALWHPQPPTLRAAAQHFQLVADLCNALAARMDAEREEANV